MPIIVLEGIDGSGKSTLAAEIIKHSPLPVTLRRGPIAPAFIDDLVTPLFEVEPDELLITDRWHLSELIYGPIYRGGSTIDFQTLADVEATLTTLRAVRVVMQPDFHEVTRRLAFRGEDFLRSNDHLLVYSAYAGLARMLDYQVVPLGDENIAKQLLEKAL